MRDRLIKPIAKAILSGLYGVSIHMAAIRVLAVVAATFGLLWALTCLYFGLYPLAALAFAFSLNCVICVLMGAYGFELSSRLMWFAVTSVIIMIGSVLVHPAGMLPQLFTGVLASVFLNFSLRDERTAAISTFAIVILAWAASLFLNERFEDLQVIGHDIAEEAIAPLVMATTLLTVAANVAVFAFLAEVFNDRQKRAIAEAERANRAKSVFLATVSHEVRTPMNGVIGMADILASSDLNDTQMRSLNVIRDSAMSLLRIIEDILDMSSAEAGKMKLVEEPLDLKATIESAAESLRTYADQNNVMAYLQMSPNLPKEIKGDAVRLRQIVINVFSNAIKFSRRPKDDRPGLATMSVTMVPGSVLEMTFTDDGIGINPEFLPQLFQAFGRSETVSTRRFGGTGLGLAIVKELVEKMKGRIRVSSTPGSGTQFTIMIPLDILQPPDPLKDLSGRRIVLAGLTSAQMEFWSRILAGTGVTRVDLPANGLAKGISSALKGGEGQGLVVISNFDDRGAMHPERLASLRAMMPDVPVIMHCRSRVRSSGLMDANTYLLQSVPALPSEAEAGVFALQNDRTSSTTLADGQAVDRPKAKEPPKDGKIRILLAEDNEINQVVLATQLTRLGHLVEVSDDGLQALKAWRASDYDLILTDCHMPEMDGIGLTSTIRSEERRLGLQPIPIVAITANAQPDEGARCLSVGMNAVLTKPVRFADLTAVIQDYVLDAPAMAPQERAERKSTV